MIPECLATLKRINYPTRVVCLDFESYFDKDYRLYGKDGKGLSTIEYVTGERFALTGLGIGRLGKRAAFIPPDRIPATLQWCKAHDREYTWVVHNGRFDVTILQVHFDWVPAYTLDTLDLASHYDSRMSHSVKDLADYFNLPIKKGDTQQFKGLHWGEMNADARAKFAEYTAGDVDIELALFEILLPKLSDPVTEARLMRHNLDIWLHRPVAINKELAKDLQLAMQVKIDNAIEMSGLTVKELRSAKFVERLQEVLPSGEKLPLKPGKKGMIPALAKTDAGCQQLGAHQKKEVRDLVEARLLVKSWPTHIKRIERIIAQAGANGGLLRVPTGYYSCHTGRNGGKEKINLLNLGGKGTGGIKTHPLIAQTRNIICALPDHILGICDSAQIEARLLAWLAGCGTLLQGFAAGADIYSDFVSPIFGTPIRKPRDTDPPEIAKDLDIKRGFGKTSILGFGYGMGADTQYNKCLANPELRPFFDAGVYDKGFVRGLVSEYRRRYLEIPALWNLLEGAFRQCIRFQHLGPVTVNDKLVFEGKESEVTIALPNGRRLYYTGCRIVNNKIKTDHGFLWGGSLCLAGYTRVLTNNGIKRLDTISLADLVWDGLSWVRHSGLKYKGRKPVIGLNGLDMTEDHQVLTVKGWTNASSAYGSSWAAVREPSGYRELRVEREKLAVESSLCLRERVHATRKRPNAKARNERMRAVFPAAQRGAYARHVASPGLPCVAEYERQVPAILTPSVEKLRWAGYKGVQALGKVRELLGRYGAELRTRANFGSNKQQRKLYTNKLPVGNAQGAGAKQAYLVGYRPGDASQKHRDPSINAILPTRGREAVTSVWDLTNCGPRRRFTVLDEAGELRLVHNCENICQSVCRDLLAYWVLRCEDEGIKVILTVYDEIVTMLEKPQAEKKFARLQEIMLEVPDWAEGLPVDAEGQLSEFYCK